jgi:hypothetical protein
MEVFATSCVYRPVRATSRVVARLILHQRSSRDRMPQVRRMGDAQAALATEAMPAAANNLRDHPSPHSHEAWLAPAGEAARYTESQGQDALAA